MLIRYTTYTSSFPWYMYIYVLVHIWIRVPLLRCHLLDISLSGMAGST